MKNSILFISFFLLTCAQTSLGQLLNSKDAIFIASKITRSTNWEALSIVFVTDTLRNRGFILESVSHLKFGNVPNMEFTDTENFENVSNYNETIRITTVGTVTGNSEVSNVSIYLQTDSFSHYIQWLNEISKNPNFALVIGNNFKPTLKVFNYKVGTASIYSKITFSPVIATDNSFLWQIKKPIIYVMTLYNIHD